MGHNCIGFDGGAGQGVEGSAVVRRPAAYYEAPPHVDGTHGKQLISAGRQHPLVTTAVGDRLMILETNLDADVLSPEIALVDVMAIKDRSKALPTKDRSRGGYIRHCFIIFCILVIVTYPVITSNTDLTISGRWRRSRFRRRLRR